jgi:hypothetical protein
MAQKRKLGPNGKPASWVRTAGAVGDDSMAKMESWNQAGAGVDEDDVGRLVVLANECEALAVG